MDLSFNFQPSQKLQRKLKNLAEKNVRTAMARAVNQTLAEGVELVKGSIPSRRKKWYEALKTDNTNEDVRDSIEILKRASGSDVTGSIGSRSILAVYLEYGTGIYNQGPNGPTSPFLIRAKNPRVIRYTRNGKQYERTVILLTFMTPAGWRSKKEVWHNGMRAVAMFRKNLSKVEYRFKRAAREEFARLVGEQ